MTRPPLVLLLLLLLCLLGYLQTLLVPMLLIMECLLPRFLDSYIMTIPFLSILMRPELLPWHTLYHATMTFPLSPISLMIWGDCWFYSLLCRHRFRTPV